MKNEMIKINGEVIIDEMKFHDIEGGFGENKKAMLVKEIAKIHNKEFKHINEAINKNRKRFKNNIDILDLKSVDLIDRDLLNGLGFSNSSIANAKNIYLLSERGYSKLLKILEDDVAWEQYEKLVDGYFSMRKEAQNTLTNYLDMSEEDKAIAYFTKLKEVKLLKAENEENAPLVELARKRLDGNGLLSITDTTKTFELKKGKITKWAKNNGYLHKTSTEVNKLGDEYFKVYDAKGFKCIGINENGLKLINEHLDEIKAS